MSKSVHMTSRIGVLRLLWDLRKDGRIVAELVLYTTDDLRRLYQATDVDSISLRDGNLNRGQLVAVIRWRVWWERFSYVALLGVSVFAAFAAALAVYEGRANL